MRRGLFTLCETGNEQVLSERLTDVVNAWMQEFGYVPDFFKIVNIEAFKND